MLMITGTSGITAEPAPSAVSYPNRPIKFFVGFSAGSGTDLVARIIAKTLSQQLGQPIIVENRAGAGGIIAADIVAKAPADGYTLLVVSSSISISPAVYAHLSFNTETDLTPIAYIGALPTVLLINRSIPSKNLREFISYAKSRPGALKFGSSGLGGSTHLFTELFDRMTSVKMTHIPYRSGAQDTVALMSGEVNVLFETLILARPLLQSGNIHALAVTGDSRSPLLPEIPTFAEAGLPRFDAQAFFGLVGPGKLPKDVVDKLNRAVNATLRNSNVIALLSNNDGLHLEARSPAQFGTLIHDEIERWQRVVKEAGIQPQ
jgi:tripartite-type tricarboxylate transporter receptor subunit TctC